MPRTSACRSSACRCGSPHNRIHAEDCLNCETKEGLIDRVDRNITLEGALSADERKRLLEIADKCPVHRTLESDIEIRTFERPA